jgi:hypothetical protein
MQFLANPRYRRLNRVERHLAAASRVRPHKQLFWHYRAATLQQNGKQLSLSQPQLQRPAQTPNFAGHLVHLDVAAVQDSPGKAGHPPQHGPHSGKHFSIVEGFHQAIVGATIEELDTLIDVAIAGDGQDWHTQTFAAQFLDHFASRSHPVAQIGIEDDQVISDCSGAYAEF